MSQIPSPSARPIDPTSGLQSWSHLLPVLVASVGAALSIVLGQLEGGLIFLVALMAIPLLRSPFLALNAVIAFSAFDSINTLIPGAVYTVTATKLVGYLLAGALFIDMAARRVLPRMDLTLMGLLALLLAGIASVWKAAEPLYVLSDFLRLAQLTILFVAVRYLVTTRERLAVLATTLVTSLSIGAAFAWNQDVAEGERLAGVSQNAAILAAELFLGVAFAAALFLNTKSFAARGLLAVALFLLVSVLGSTETRAAFLAVIPAGLAAIMLGRRFGRYLIGIGAVVLVSFLIFGGIAERLTAAVEASDNSTRSRYRTVHAGMVMIQESPVLGVGLGNFRVHYLRITNDPLGLAKTAHNSYLSFAAETGIVGLSCWLVFLAVGTATLWRTGRRAHVAGSHAVQMWFAMLGFALVGFIFMALFHTLHFAKYFWVLMALASNASLILNNDIAEAQAAESDEP